MSCIAFRKGLHRRWNWKKLSATGFFSIRFRMQISLSGETEHDPKCQSTRPDPGMCLTLGCAGMCTLAFNCSVMFVWRVNIGHQRAYFTIYSFSRRNL